MLPRKRARNGDHAKPWWLAILESAGGAALITVFLGGLGAQWINRTIQRAQTERDFNNAWLKARGDQALSAYKDYALEQARVIDQLYTAVGSMVAAAEALVAAADWDRSNPGTDKEAINIAKAFNAAEDEWVKSGRRFTFLLSYYSDANRDVVRRWRGVSAAVDTYRECVSTWYERYDGQNRFPPELICGVQKARIDNELNGLGDALEVSRTYLWNGWKNPNDLRRSLTMPND